MFKITLKTDLPQRIENAKAKLDNQFSSLLQQVGVYISSEQRYSFDEMSRGGVGADGTRWKPLTDATEIKKASKRAAFKKQRARAKKLMGQLRAAKDAKKRKGILEKLQKARVIPQSQIGVDTGLLRNSATPGYAGPDGKGGNVFSVSGSRVTVGYGRSYAEYFDEVRRLMPSDANPPSQWLVGIDQIVTEWAQGIVDDLGK